MEKEREGDSPQRVTKNTRKKVAPPSVPRRVGLFQTGSSTSHPGSEWPNKRREVGTNYVGGGEGGRESVAGRFLLSEGRGERAGFWKSGGEGGKGGDGEGKGRWESVVAVNCRVGLWKKGG